MTPHPQTQKMATRRIPPQTPRSPDPTPGKGGPGGAAPPAGGVGAWPPQHAKEVYWRFPPIHLSHLCSGDRIRTCDLWVMSPASYRAAPPRVVVGPSVRGVESGFKPGSPSAVAGGR